jgi:hypothetical protein
MREIHTRERQRDREKERKRERETETERQRERDLGSPDSGPGLLKELPLGTNGL